MNNGLTNNRFDGVQALRALAAFSVVINHMAFVENGGFGVDIFFCISGFIMMYVTEKNASHFISKRIIRIIPLYYIMTLFTYICALLLPALFEKTSMELSFLIKSLLFIPFDIGNNIIQPIVRVGWTLNYEVFFYVILWISLLISHKYRGIIAAAIIFLCVSTGFVSDNLITPLKYWSDTIIIEFVFGMLAYYIVKYLTKNKAYAGMQKMILLLTAVLLYVFMWLVKYIDFLSDIPRVIIFGIPAFIIFVTVFLATYGCRMPKVIVYLGDISYSVYLIHYFIVRLFNHYVCPDGVADITVIILAIILVGFIIAISSVSYYIIEKKCSQFLRNIIKI